MTTAARTRIKICGITRIDDAHAAIAAGVDALGLVFYPRSPRYLDIESARLIVDQLPPLVTVVGVFVNQTIEQVREIADVVCLDILQLHGDETPEQCRRYGRPYIKGVRMRDGVDLTATAHAFPDCRGLLLDTYKPGIEGGTGETFSWKRIPATTIKPVILAGGLNPANVGEAIEKVRPFAIDVSSGVEKTQGVKDAQKIVSLVEAVRGADR
jgi:phosphoribosylanthranilate isomerase